MAQRRPAWSLDLTLGATGSATDANVWPDRAGGPSVDLTLAWCADATRRSVVVAINTAAYGVPAGGDVCHVAPNGGCMPDHPAFAFVGALVGWESARSRLRVMGGAGSALGQWDTGSLGLQARADAAFPLVRHVALVGSVRGLLVPDHRDQGTYQLAAVGVGLRLRTR